MRGFFLFYFSTRLVAYGLSRVIHPVAAELIAFMVVAGSITYMLTRKMPFL